MEQPPKIFGDSKPQFSDAGVIDNQTVATFMSTVFTWMFIGLLVTAGTAYYSASSGLYYSLMSGMGYWFVLLAPFAFILVMNFGIEKLSVSAMTMCFLAFAGTMGLSLGGIFFAYNLGSIFQVFLITAGTFGVMAFAGYTTKVDLSRMGSLLFMGLIGIIIASIVNWFMGSAMLDFLISIGGVLIFTGLVAYDTQRLRRIAEGVEYGAIAPMKLALLGALALYLNFINLFLFLLRLLGNRD